MTWPPALTQLWEDACATLLGVGLLLALALAILALDRWLRRR